MRVKSSAWSEDPRFSHCKIMVEVCPPHLLPTVRQNMASGGVAIDWPDVCHCPTNGGATLEVHAVQESCISASVENELIQWCGCPEGSCNSKHLSEPGHVDGCPFDSCPLGTCHPMCSQATGDEFEVYCHCACHG